MSNYTGAVGPGSQPSEEDGGVLEYMEMPKGMTVFRSPILPEPDQLLGVDAAKAALRRVMVQLKDWKPGTCPRIELSGLDKQNVDFISQALGDGEVSIICGGTIQCQESVMAGVWRVRETGAGGVLVSDAIEIGIFPQSVIARAFAGSSHAITIPRSYGPGVFNAPPLLAEINEAIAKSGLGGAAPHAINLSLLPHTEEDLSVLDELLGQGPVTILSRGYGNCRVMTTALRDTWWVRFYNSQDTLILNSIEVSNLPDVVCASPEDIIDSAERLSEIMAIY
ncbi:hydrogenase expression/formation protein [Rhizobium aegyptiacum]|uniref:hydrogenase expression/formation protein n=1 Tax=Rhizobium aegyptiacum TaxID=1764550 RepID=UPI0007E5A663|nr:hydrogenase expression/formation protein [Rhizobium aegyptiacum]